MLYLSYFVEFYFCVQNDETWLNVRFFVTIKSFTSRTTVRKMWLFFDNVLWWPSDLETLVHNNTLSANFLGTFLCKVKNSQYIQHYLPPNFWHLTSTTIQKNCQETLLFQIYFLHMYLEFNRYSNIRENFFGRKKWQHLSCTVQWPSRFVVCSIVKLSVKLKSVLTQCACKRLRINLEFFSEPSKKKEKIGTILS